MSKERVIFDIDGVLADFIVGFTTVAAEVFGTPIRANGSQREWDFAVTSRTHYSHPLTREQEQMVWDRIGERPFFRDALPVLTSPGDMLHMRQLAEVADIFYVTNRRGNLAQSHTEHWLETHDFPKGTVVALTGSKLGPVREIGPVAMIDDRPMVIEEISADGWSIWVRDWPYNRHVTAGAGRVSSVAEFCDTAEKRIYELQKVA